MFSPVCRYALITLKFHTITDGQKIAKKLCVQISKETRTIRSLLADYHACQSNTEVSCDFISLSEALNPCAVGDKLQVVGVWCSIATGDRQAIIDAYLTLCRSKEEISMLTEEARNVTVYYEEQRKAVLKELEAKLILTAEELHHCFASCLLRSANCWNKVIIRLR